MKLLKSSLSLSGLSLWLLLLAVLSIPSDVKAQSIFSTGDFSIEGSYSPYGFYNFNSSVINENQPLGLTGTVYYITFYTTDVAGSVASIEAGNNGYYVLKKCTGDFYYDSGDWQCDGSLTSSSVKNSNGDIPVIVDGNYITLELTTPITFTAGDYASISYLTRNNIKYSGYDFGTCLTLEVGFSPTCPDGFDAIFIEFSDSGGFVQDLSTHFLEFQYPTQGQNIATTTGGQIHTAEVGYSFSIFNGDLPVSSVSLSFTNTDFFASYNVFGTTTATGTNYFIGTTTLPAGNYTASIVMSNTDEGYGYAESDLISFSVGGANYIDVVLGVDPNDPTNLLGLATSTCSISNISGCFQNALVMLFWPSASSTEKILGIGSLIAKKPPIGYFTAVANEIADITGSSTPTMAITIPDGIIDLFFNPLNVAITGILWWFFAIHFWHRLKNLHIV